MKGFEQSSIDQALLDRTPLSQDELIIDWVGQAERGNDERRKYKRHNAFTPVRMTTVSEPDVELSAFSRDVSTVGVGLLHDQPLERDLACVQFSRPNVKVLVRIEQCRMLQDNWFASFGRFKDLGSSDFAKLFLSTVTKMVCQRFASRFPFFKPMTLTVGGSQDRDLRVFSRDISWMGMGLFHNKPLPIKRAMLGLVGQEGFVRGKICWCRPAGNGWFTSGVRFDSLSLEEFEPRGR